MADQPTTTPVRRALATIVRTFGAGMATTGARLGLMCGRRPYPGLRSTVRTP